MSRIPNSSLLGAEGFSLWRILRLGEPFIWLAGAACALVLFMILAMLALAFFEGAAFFWSRHGHLNLPVGGGQRAAAERKA